ncbi:nitroreductase family protein [Amycolatopsis sp. NPDC049868]|uniref:nitroreductase family protein n=1 Tax=Amycolatopsis sp. NPDC049868 TaxID=3363934 RepID=UPI0037AA9EBE
MLLAAAKGVAGTPHRPDVLVVLTSKTNEPAGKYQGLGYSLTPRNAGVVYQNLYLLAAATGLAACALGFGDNALVRRALSLSFPDEIPVGEFMLGTCPEIRTD